MAPTLFHEVGFMKTSTKRLTALAALIATAMILSFIESQIPPIVPLPGVKLGLANIAVIFTLYKLGIWQSASVSLIRVILSALLFGNSLALIYSFAGAVFSLIFMIFLKNVVKMHTVGVSVAGAVMHNAAQIAVASIVMETAVIIYYLPWLIISGTLAGIVIGIIGYQLIKRIKL